MMSPQQFILSVLKCFIFKNVRQRLHSQAGTYNRGPGEVPRQGPAKGSRETGGTDGAGGARRDDDVVPAGGTCHLIGQVTPTPTALFLRLHSSGLTSRLFPKGD